MGAWGREHGDSTMGTAPSEQQQFFYYLFQRKILHRMIEIIYFDGSIGTGGEGQQFFYYHGSMGTGAWGREHGDGSMGTAL